MQLHIQTPLIKSEPLSQVSGKNIWLKMEALQPTGSFKNRGVCFACQEVVKQGAQALFSSSGGNAGIAVAYAGRKLGIPVTVVVPETTSAKAIELLKNENAKVIVHGESWQEANELIQTLTGDGKVFIHPFDDPLVWQGHGTMIDEIHQAGLKPDAVILSVGGGGMLSGVGDGLKRNGWQDVPLLAIETEGAASFNQAIKANQPIELNEITSVATTLGAKRVCQQAFDLSKQLSVQSILVSDQQALNACRQFLSDHRVLVEPSCGASLSIAYDHAEKLKDFENIVIIVCGGVTATIEQINKWQLGLREPGFPPARE